MPSRRAAAGTLLALLVLAGACAQAPADDPDGRDGAPTVRTPGAAEADGDGRTAGGDGPVGEGYEGWDASVADVTRSAQDFVVWADDVRGPALLPFVEAFGRSQDLTVAVQEAPLEQIRDQLHVAAATGDGPDVVLGRHDWLGELVGRGLVAPVELDRVADQLEEVTVDAVTYEGATYGLPYAFDSVALVRNTDHAPDAPTTWDELEATASALEDRGAVTRGLVLPADPPDPYYAFPLLSAFGGYVFPRDEDGAYDVSDVGLDSAGGVEAARRLRDWVATGLIDPEVSAPLMAELFGRGEAAYAIAGPSDLAPTGEGLESLGVDYAVSPLPPIDGGTPRPFVEVEAAFVATDARDPDLAQRFLLEQLASDEAQRALHEATGRPPARSSTAERLGRADVEGFAASAREGVPLPATPAMGAVWTVWAEALDRVYRGAPDPGQVLSEAADEVRDLHGP